MHYTSIADKNFKVMIKLYTYLIILMFFLPSGDLALQVIFTPCLLLWPQSWQRNCLAPTSSDLPLLRLLLLLPCCTLPTVSFLPKITFRNTKRTFHQFFRSLKTFIALDSHQSLRHKSTQYSHLTSLFPQFILCLPQVWDRWAKTPAQPVKLLFPPVAGLRTYPLRPRYRAPFSTVCLLASFTPDTR